jgi:hypothetical protein
MIVNPPSAKNTDYWLGETIPTNNRFSALTHRTVEDSPNQSTDPKPPPIFTGILLSKSCGIRSFCTAYISALIVCTRLMVYIKEFKKNLMSLSVT